MVLDITIYYLKKILPYQRDLVQNPATAEDVYNIVLRGPGVLDLGMMKIEFDVVFDRGKCQLPDTFYGI